MRCHHLRWQSRMGLQEGLWAAYLHSLKCQARKSKWHCRQWEAREGILDPPAFQSPVMPQRPLAEVRSRQGNSSSQGPILGAIWENKPSGSFFRLWEGKHEPKMARLSDPRYSFFRPSSSKRKLFNSALELLFASVQPKLERGKITGN